jgi:hypothetical protein
MNSDKEIVAEFIKFDELEGFQYYKFSCSETNNSWFLVRRIDLVGQNEYYNLSNWWYEFGMPSTVEKVIDLEYPITINSIQITPGRYSNCAPRDFRVEGSKDNTNWVLLFEQSDLPSSVWYSGSTMTFDFSEKEVFEHISGIDMNSDGSSLLYPNPTKGIVYISPDINSENIQIINLMGQVVLNASSDSKRLDLSELKSGVYIVKINEAAVRLVKE